MSALSVAADGVETWKVFCVEVTSLNFLSFSSCKTIKLYSLCPANEMVQNLDGKDKVAEKA